MGGRPDDTVAKIREMVYMNEKEKRDQYLGEVNVICVVLKLVFY